MSQSPLRLAIIIGSTREGRFADTVASWFVARARQRDDFDVDVIDLVELGLPPNWIREHDEATAAFSKRIDAADCFVVITPEYNHSFPAGLKQAIDLLKPEWKHKAVGFVAYGGISGGLRAVEHLRTVFAELHVATIRETVSLHGAFQLFDEQGEHKDPAVADLAATTLLDDLAWWGHALRNAREADAARA
jgi:NAD(P)H-dependent FMN reductase